VPRNVIKETSLLTGKAYEDFDYNVLIAVCTGCRKSPWWWSSETFCLLAVHHCSSTHVVGSIALRKGPRRFCPHRCDCHCAPTHSKQLIQNKNGWSVVVDCRSRQVTVAEQLASPSKATDFFNANFPTLPQTNPYYQNALVMLTCKQ